MYDMQKGRIVKVLKHKYRVTLLTGPAKGNEKDYEKHLVTLVRPLFSSGLPASGGASASGGGAPASGGGGLASGSVVPPSGGLAPAVVPARSGAAGPGKAEDDDDLDDAFD